jgi:hypothetical protein
MAGASYLAGLGASPGSLVLKIGSDFGLILSVYFTNKKTGSPRF